MALVTEHDFLLLLNPPVGVPSIKLQPVILHPVWEEGFVYHLAGRQLQRFTTNPRDGANTDISQIRDVLLQQGLPSDGGVPVKGPPDLPDTPKRYLAGQVPWMLLCIG